MVSRWPASVAAEVSLVASSPRGCVLCAKNFALRGLVVGVSAKNFALRGLVVGVSAKKFALRTKNSPKLAVYGVLGEVFRENTAEGAALGELFRGRAAGGPLPGELFRGPSVEGAAGRVCGALMEVASRPPRCRARAIP